MRTAGIVCEYNPLHTGHQYHLRETAKHGFDAIICVMSGHFVQRGDISMLPKWTRAEAALLAGANLVIELPSAYALQSAEGFARSAVSLLLHAGVSAISFGSESGDAAALASTARLMHGERYELLLREGLDRNCSYAKARQRAATQLGGQGCLLASPNDNLGIEYCRALHAFGATAVPLAILRTGSGHHDLAGGDFCSATAMRRACLNRDHDFFARYTPCQVSDLYRSVLTESGTASLARLERAALAHLRTQSPETLRHIADVSAGFEHRLLAAVRGAHSIDALADAACSATVTKSRVRRIVLRSFLGLYRGIAPELPAYLRVLGFDRIGRQLLASLKRTAQVPIVTKAADHKRLLNLEARLTDLYALCFESVQPMGWEYTHPPVLLDR